MDCSVPSASTFPPSIRDDFIHHIQNSPNNRRISRTERTTIIGWLTDPANKPTSQQQSSRRNYIRKRFEWNDSRAELYALVKGSETERKEVVTEDRIVDTVESVHVNNGHGGWDATWNDIAKSYYGILRADVIFLVKQCEICAQNPRKRPKKGPHFESGQAEPEAGDDIGSETVNLKDCLWNAFLHEAPDEPVDPGGT